MPDFFDKIVNEVGKSITNVGTTSKATLEKNQINAAINTLKSERKDLCNLLGERIYSMYLETSSLSIDEGVENFFSELKKRDEAIAERKLQIEKINAETSLATGVKTYSSNATCKCGHLNSPNSTFCSKCGNKLA